MSEPINATISPWHPEHNKVRLAVLGKLAEECNELGARTARCIIQGIEEIDPDTGLSNREELEREIADVIACIEVANETLGLSPDDFRTQAKMRGFYRWHDMIEAGK